MCKQQSVCAEERRAPPSARVPRLRDKGAADEAREDHPDGDRQQHRVEGIGEGELAEEGRLVLGGRD